MAGGWFIMDIYIYTYVYLICNAYQTAWTWANQYIYISGHNFWTKFTVDDILHMHM